MAVISKHRKICSKLKQASGCPGNKSEQTAIRTPEFTADGFLRKQFPPLYELSGEPPDKEQSEKVFFRSLSILTAFYGLKAIDVSGKPYPYNVLLSYWEARRLLNKGNQEVELMIMEHEQGEICLVTRKAYDTGATLYYIPVIPLYKLLQDRRQKPAGELLLSVFSYLYHRAGIPYYRHLYSALDSYYEMVKEWFVEDWDSREEMERNQSISEMNTAEYFGDIMLRKLRNPYHLNHFEQRIKHFKAIGDFQKNCLSVARAAFELFSRYPQSCVFDHNSRDEDEQEYDDGIIRMEQYISFVANNEGWLHDSIVQMVDGEVSECGSIEEPSIVRVFDSHNLQEDEGLDFEEQLFPLITDLCTLLNQIP